MHYNVSGTRILTGENEGMYDMLAKSVWEWW